MGKARLEEKFIEAWRGREDSDCLWWNGEWWTWRRFAALVDDCTAKLEKAGFVKGQRLAVLLPNSPMVLALSLATWRLGGAVAPLNSRTGIVNMLDSIRKVDPHSIVVRDEKLAESVTAARTIGVPVVGAMLDAPLPSWLGRVGAAESEDYAIFFSTSGTSGNPKAVGCYHSNLLDNINLLPDHVPGLIAPDSIFLNVLPNFHTFGSDVAGYLPLLSGVRQTLIASFVPVEHTIQTIRETGTNIIIAVPTIMAFLISSLAKKDEKLEGVKIVITGGDRLNTQMDERCKRYLGVGIQEGYGLTECSPVVSMTSMEKTKKLGKVGTLLKSYEVQIRDREGRRLGLHDEGVLWVRGPSVAPGYYRDEVNTKERFDGEWFNTGDVVRIDEDGFVQIVDRATDIIIVSGFNVYPQEVEAVLCEHPAVHSAIAVGEKNSVAGELVKAFVILNEGKSVTARELVDYCKERLAHYKVPHKIGFVTEYPVSPTGKVLRRELRHMKITRG